MVIPDGDVKHGKALFDELCAACHAMSVRYIFTVGW